MKSYIGQVFLKPPNIGYIRQFWNKAARTHPTRPADRPFANIQRWGKWKWQMSAMQENGKKVINDNNVLCIVDNIQISHALPSNTEYT